MGNKAARRSRTATGYNGQVPVDPEVILKLMYVARRGVCAACPLRGQCTTSQFGRAVHRYREHELVIKARAQATSRAARRDHHRRHLMEGSFAQGANCHGCKRARWRRLWRQQIQDWLIAACQNIKLILRALPTGPVAGENRGQPGPQSGPAAALRAILRPFRADFAGFCPAALFLTPTFR